jgi:transcriptional regulator
MRENPDYALTDPDEVRGLIRSAPWATMVSSTSGGLVASHYPFLLDEEAEEITVLSHVGRPDERLHELGSHELLVIFSGPSGYVSPSWYGLPTAVPTWNFATVHAYGTPELLDGAENLAVLDRLVDHFEDRLPDPFRMRGTLANAAYAERIVRGTVGIRLRVTRFVGKDKMSQDKPDDVVEQVIEELEAPGPYQNPALAGRMRQVRARG